MMGPRQEAQLALFYEFSLEDHVPQSHLLRSIDRFVDLSGIRSYLADFFSHTGRPSVDPELLIRMLLVGYCFGIRSERRLCEEVHLNLAYRWFCRLDLSDRVPDHSTFSKNRHGRFRDSELLRHLFETTVARCIAEGLVSGQRMAVDASLIEAELHRNHVFISFGQISGNLAGFFMFFTGDRSGVRIGAALRFEWANLAGQFQSTYFAVPLPVGPRFGSE